LFVFPESFQRRVGLGVGDITVCIVGYMTIIVSMEIPHKTCPCVCVTQTQIPQNSCFVFKRTQFSYWPTWSVLLSSVCTIYHTHLRDHGAHNKLYVSKCVRAHTDNTLLFTRRWKHLFSI